jgi:hypothetical protein
MSNARRELAALGAQEAPAAPPASGGGDRTFGFAPHLSARLLTMVLAALLIAVPVCILVIGNGGSAVHAAGAQRSTPVARYGGLPSWLPKAKVPVNRVLDASATHSVLTIQGTTVSVALAHGRAFATAVGPSVPEDGRFPVPATSPCTFVVTFAQVSGAIPLSRRAFTLVDEYGHIRHPRVTSMDGGPPPTRIVPGRPLSLKIYDVLPTGDGGLEWAPYGRRPLVSWDFNVEID